MPSNIVIKLGDAFLIDTPPNGQHLYIAIAPIPPDRYLFVNVTTLKANSETTCILNPGGGVPGFVVHQSVIAYQFARDMNELELARFSRSKTFVLSCDRHDETRLLGTYSRERSP